MKIATRPFTPFAAAALVLVLVGCSDGDSSAPDTTTIELSEPPSPPSATVTTPATTPATTSLEAPAATVGIVESTSAETEPGSSEADGLGLNLQCAGSGSPTIVLEAGTDEPVDALSELQERLARTNTTCVYERAHATEVRTAADATADLHDLLIASGVRGRSVLVGQSIGGELVQLYARNYPDEVAAVVAMNSGPPCGPWLAALPQLDNADLLAGETAYCADSGGTRDRFDGRSSSQQEQTAPPPPDIPFELVISTVDADWCPPTADVPEPFDSQDQCHAAHAIHESLARDIVAEWPQGHLSEIAAPHAIYSTDLDAIVSLVLATISRAVEQ